MFKDNDASNQELYNLRIHNVDASLYNEDDTDLLYQIARGEPDYGKQAYVGPGGEAGMVGGYVDVCVDVEPEPLFSGGGTRARLQYGILGPGQIEIDQGATIVANDPVVLERLIDYKDHLVERGVALVSGTWIVGDGEPAGSWSAVMSDIDLLGTRLNCDDTYNAGTYTLLAAAGGLKSGGYVTAESSSGPQFTFVDATGATLPDFADGDRFSFHARFPYRTSLAA